MLCYDAVLNSAIEHMELYGQQEAEECINYIQTMEGMFGANKDLFNRTIDKLHNIIARERARLTVELRNKRNSMRTPTTPTQGQGQTPPNTPMGGPSQPGTNWRGRGRGRGGKRPRSRSRSRSRQPTTNLEQGPQPHYSQGQGQQQVFRGRRPQARGTARGGIRRPAGQQRMAPPNQAQVNQNRLHPQQGTQTDFRSAVMQGLQVMMDSLNMPQ